LPSKNYTSPKPNNTNNILPQLYFLDKFQKGKIKLILHLAIRELAAASTNKNHSKANNFSEKFLQR